MCARPQKLFTTPMTAGDRNARFQMRSDALNCDDSFLSAIDDDSNLHNPPWLWSGNRLPELRLYSAMRARPLSNERGTRSRRAVETKRMYRRVQSLPASRVFIAGPGAERPFPL